jgi:hypothetical protein
MSSHNCPHWRGPAAARVGPRPEGERMRGRTWDTLPAALWAAAAAVLLATADHAGPLAPTPLVLPALVAAGALCHFWYLTDRCPLLRCTLLAPFALLHTPWLVVAAVHTHPLTLLLACPPLLLAAACVLYGLRSHRAHAHAL